VRYISTPSDHLMLALLLAIGITGPGYAIRGPHRHRRGEDVCAGTDATGLAEPARRPGLAGASGLVALLMLIFPISKLLHAPGLFFSPTRNQADNAREVRHVSAWAAALDKRP
jgi:nitrate reductase gamma subunit